MVLMLVSILFKSEYIIACFIVVFCKIEGKNVGLFYMNTTKRNLKSTSKLTLAKYDVHEQNLHHQM